MKLRKKIVLIIAILTINIAADQITKVLAREHLKDQGTIQVIGDFMILRYAENDGAFLGMASDIPYPIKIITLIVIPSLALIAGLIYLFWKKDLPTIEIVLASCIIGGGLGNVIDRIAFNLWVTDFLNFGIGSLRTGILNIADMSVFFGAILFLIFYSVRIKKQESKQDIQE